MISLLFSDDGNIFWEHTKTNLELNKHYHSFSEQSVCLVQLQTELCQAANIYLQPAKIKSQHFGVSLKFLVCN